MNGFSRSRPLSLQLQQRGEGDNSWTFPETLLWRPDESWKMETGYFKGSNDLGNCSFGSWDVSIPGELAIGLALADCIGDLPGELLEVTKSVRATALKRFV